MWDYIRSLDQEASIVAISPFFHMATKKNFAFNFNGLRHIFFLMRRILSHQSSFHEEPCMFTNVFIDTLYPTKFIKSCNTISFFSQALGMTVQMIPGKV